MEAAKTDTSMLYLVKIQFKLLLFIMLFKLFY